MRSNHLKRHMMVHKKESDLKIRKRRKITGFISIEDFNRLAYCDPIPWIELADGCIYQLQWVNPHGSDVIGNMLAQDGTSVSVKLPRSVVEKLLTISEDESTGGRMYIRKKDGDQADIVTLKRYLCNVCKKELTTCGHLRRHKKLCNKSL